MFNFPDAPINGQVVSTPGGTYSYDGAKWVPGQSSLSEAPIDGRVYGRQGSITSWVPVLPLTGGTLTGPLTLSANPVNPLDAVTKQYSDGKVAKTGDTM